MNVVEKTRHHVVLLSALILLLAASCSAASDGPTPLESDSINGVIFTAEQTARYPYLLRNNEAWTPAKDDVLALEGELAPYVQREYPDLWPKMNQYARQYLGSTTAVGTHLIYANFFCDAHDMLSDSDWQKSLVAVEDGGDCYFQTLYDVEGKSFLWLTVNGES